MTEGLKTESTPKPYPSEGKLLIEGMLEQLGVSMDEFSGLPAAERASVMGQIRETLRQPEISEILREREEQGLSAETAQKIRDAFGGEKWNKLSEVVSYVKTLLGEKTPEERSATFAKHLAFGVDANEIQHTLTRIHDVMPARIDTDIRHQSSFFYRAVVEVASNALDASIKHRSPIGRFGVGFYQILNHLKDPKDKVVVRTKSADFPTGIKIEFRNRNEEILLKVSEDNTITDQGTTVELSSKEFEAGKAETMIRDYFSHTQDAELVINGQRLDRWEPDGGAEAQSDLPTIDIKVENGRCIVTDKGIGMPPRVIFEKLLVPKLSEKPPIYELRERGIVAPKIYFEGSHSDDEEVGEIIIQVGGIVIEREECKGVRVAKTLVIDLPPSTILGEQRNEVEVNKDTVEAMKDAVDQAIRLPRPQCFEVINTLSVACRKLQNRSKLYGPGDNVFVYLQEKVKETFPELSFLPNKKDFLALDIDPEKVAFLDPTVYQTPFRSIHGLKEVRAWNNEEGVPLFEAKFKSGSTLGIIQHDNLIIVDDRTNVAENPEIATNAIQLAVGYGKGRVFTSAELLTEREREIKSFDTLEGLVSEQWRVFSFKSKEIALRQVRLYEKKNPEVTNAFTKKIFNQLHTVGAMEAWDALHWYVNGDTRDRETQLQEIDHLASNISIFLSNPKVSNIIQTNKIPILSMFETFAPDIPGHIRSKEGFEQREVVIQGKKYYFFQQEYGFRSSEEWGSSQIECFTEDGKVIRLYAHNQLYKDENIAVYKDRIEDTKTGETIDYIEPIETPLGTIVSNKRRNKDEVFFSFVESDACKYIKSHREGDESSLRRSWNIQSAQESGDRLVYVNGVKEANLSEVIRRAQIPEGCELSNVIRTVTGDVRLVFSNVKEKNNGYYFNYEFEESRQSEQLNPRKEAFYITDKNGEIVWQLDEEEWGSKIYPDNLSATTEDGERYQLLDQTRMMAARCILVKQDGPLAESDPVVKIVRYDFIGQHRIREVLGYITAFGEVVHTTRTDKVNETTLDAKYAWESSCTCCQVDVAFHKGLYSPFDNMIEGREPRSGNFVELPVTIVGEFKFDEVRHEWIALSAARNHRDFYMAVFDERGNFLHTEEIGYMPQIINGEYDWRDLEEYIPHRLPDRLRDLDTRDRDKSWWKYEDEIAKFVSFKDGIILNERVGQSYGSKYIPNSQEVDNVDRGLFELRKGELTPEHIKVLEKFLLKYPIPDREKLERVTYRLMEYRSLAPEDVEFLLPVFYEVPAISPDFFTPQMVEVLKSVSYLDSERFVQLFTMMYGSLPDDEEGKYKITSKVIKFYKEKLQSESLENTERIIGDLRRVREYKNAIQCDGFTLIKHGVSVPAAEVPRNIRPFLTFIQSEEDELASREVGRLDIPETEPQTMRLSEIIQWKRLRETEAKNFTQQDLLEEAVHKATHGKTREHIVREITHAVHFQALNSTDLYVRELIQNAVDVMQGESMAKQDRNIEITTSVTENEELVTHFHDPVGMDMKTVLNYFLVPGESTKMDRSKNFIGFYGQGVYTLFKNFKEINIKTSAGDGKVCYLTMKPIIEHDMVADVSIDFRSAEEEFKGTIISKMQSAENPYVEAAYVKDAVMTLTSALSDDRASVIYQSEKVNSEYKVLSKSNVANLGEVTIYRNPNNIISQYGLYVKDINSEYFGRIPGFMRESLQEWGGVAIDLPKGVELTRSRQDIANKDKVADILNPQIQRNLVAGYFESFKEKMISGEVSFPYENLPDDYFFEAERYEVPQSFKNDASALINGEPLEHLDEYTDESKALKLMTALPLFDVKGQRVSLDEIRRAFIAKNKPAPFNQEGWMADLPRRLTRLMEEQRQQRSSAQAQREDASKDAIPDDTLTGIYERAPEELKRWIDENKEHLQSLGVLTQVFIDSIDEVFIGSKQTRGLFHYSRTGEIAHARRGGNMSWNLSGMKDRTWGSPLEQIKKYRGEEGRKIINLWSPISTVAHEYGHVIEDLTGWSHDPKHDKEQARILLQFLIQNGPSRLLESLNLPGPA